MRLYGFAAAALGLGVLFAAGAVPARAQVSVQGIRWQLSTGTPSRPAWHDVKGWLQPPASRIERRPRVLLELRNLSSRAEEAVLLRFAVSARLAKKEGGDAEGRWSLPFLLEDRRVPRIKAGETRPLPIHLNRVVLQTYLLRLHRAGFWPDALRIQVMVEPRSGEELQDPILEQILPVFWRQPSHNGAGIAP